MQYNNRASSKGICPEGWHIPSDVEFQLLANFVNQNGNALKAAGQGKNKGAGNNASGFSALLSGYRSTDGYFYYFGFAFFWSSSEGNPAQTRHIDLYFANPNIGFIYDDKKYGFSVRCLKD